MKNFLSSILFLLCLTFNSTSLYANQFADKVVGTWYVTASVDANVQYKNWSGSISISKAGDSLVAVLDWTSENGEWHVIQNMDVTKERKQIILQGIDVNVVSHPDGMSEYSPDRFTFNLSEKDNNTIPVTAGDANGTQMMFTIKKSN